jgi:hypothetical protein
VIWQACCHVPSTTRSSSAPPRCHCLCIHRAFRSDTCGRGGVCGGWRYQSCTGGMWGGLFVHRYPTAEPKLQSQKSYHSFIRVTTPPPPVKSDNSNPHKHPPPNTPHVFVGGGVITLDPPSAPSPSHLPRLQGATASAYIAPLYRRNRH